MRFSLCGWWGGGGGGGREGVGSKVIEIIELM